MQLCKITLKLNKKEPSKPKRSRSMKILKLKENQKQKSWERSSNQNPKNGLK
jgi:hypothetical protein